MKSILLSIKPEWVAKILNGEKTIEIRKTAPKCKLPIDVYIYCTKGKRPINLPWEFDVKKTNEGYVADAEFKEGNGKVVARFTLEKAEQFLIEPFGEGSEWEDELLSKACLSLTKLDKYLDGEFGYAWHISDLVIFDKPKELSEFKLSKAPQSWMYVDNEEK